MSSLDELLTEAIVFETLEYPLSFQPIRVVLELLNKAPVHLLCQENGLKEAKYYLELIPLGLFSEGLYYRSVMFGDLTGCLEKLNGLLGPAHIQEATELLLSPLMATAGSKGNKSPIDHILCKESLKSG